MQTLVLKAAEPEEVRAAARLLREGRLVAFPTETVYGLGARRDDERALQRLYEVKGRPRDKKLAVLVADPVDAERYTGSLVGAAATLAEHFWPGPLTLVVPDGRGGTVGLRCPRCEPTREMLRKTRVPVAAPSANLSGEPPALRAEEVMEVFKGRIAAVLDGGEAPLGVASTVVRIRGDGADILREGAVKGRQIEEVLRAAEAG